MPELPTTGSPSQEQAAHVIGNSLIFFWNTRDTCNYWSILQVKQLQPDTYFKLKLEAES